MDSTTTLVSFKHERQLLEAEQNPTEGLAHCAGRAASHSTESIQKRVERNYRFSTGQRRTQAVVYAHAESNVIAQVTISGTRRGQYTPSGHDWPNRRRWLCIHRRESWCLRLPRLWLLYGGVFGRDSHNARSPRSESRLCFGLIATPAITQVALL